MKRKEIKLEGIKIRVCPSIEFKDGTTYMVIDKELYKYKDNRTCNEFEFSIVDDDGEKVRDFTPEELLIGACLVEHNGEEKLLKFD